MIGNGGGTLVATGTERTARSPAGRMRLADQKEPGGPGGWLDFFQRADADL